MIICIYRLYNNFNIVSYSININELKEKNNKIKHLNCFPMSIFFFFFVITCNIITFCFVLLLLLNCNLIFVYYIISSVLV